MRTSKPYSLTFLFSLTTLALSIYSADASPVRAAHIEVDLLSEREAVTANETQYVGILFKPDPEWHVYWKNPGDSGLAPEVEWKSSSSEVELSDFIFPSPEKIPFGPLVNFGYRGEVLLLAKLQSQNLKSGTEIEITAKTKWLVCKEECVPGKATLTIKLPVVDSGVYQKTEGAHNSLFARTVSDLPIQKKPEADPKIRIIHTKDSVERGTFEFHLTAKDKKISQELLQAMTKSQIFFFPNSEYGFDASTKQTTKKEPAQEEIHLVHSVTQNKHAPHAEIQGVLRIGNRHYEVSEIFDPTHARKNNQGSNPSTESLPLMLFFALVGGLILNLMPCILPVLSIKVMEIVGKSGESRSELKREGLIYTFGVLVSFWVLAAILLSLRSSGTHLGWGFQLQSPIFVGGLAVLFFLMGLNLMGVFEFGGRLMGFGNNLTQQGGWAGSFFTGVLTTIAATPCSAPFMGTALGFALTQPPVVSVLVLSFLGLGLALPYLVFSFFPGSSKLLPRPGKWMETLKQFLAFPLFGTVIWLVSIVTNQSGSEGALHVLSASLLAYFAIWLFSKKPEKLIPQASRVTLIGVAVVFSAVLIFGIQKKEPNAEQTKPTGIWSKFSYEALNSALDQKKTVLVNLTADWCVTCKVNEVVAFENESVLKIFNDLSVVTLMGDWTQGDPLITEYMMRHGRNSVPVYLLYKNGNKEPEILPQILTPKILEGKLNSK